MNLAKIGLVTPIPGESEWKAKFYDGAVSFCIECYVKTYVGNFVGNRRLMVNLRRGFWNLNFFFFFLYLLNLKRINIFKSIRHFLNYSRNEKEIQFCLLLLEI